MVNDEVRDARERKHLEIKAKGIKWKQVAAMKERN